MAGVAGFNDVDPLPTVGGLTFAGHHVVSQSIFKDSDLFKALKANGFDVNSFASNGIPLPNTPSGAAATGMAYHAGGHPAYNDWVRARMSVFESQFAAFNGNVPPGWLEARSADINGFKAFVQTELMNPNSPMALVAKDLPDVDTYYNSTPASPRSPD